MEFEPKKPLGLFQLVMINVIAVDSIRTLSFSAVYGLSLLFFYLVASLAFLFPTALVSAELGTGWPNRGGIYVWVREAFGKKWSFLVIWLNWVYNVIWYPTIMALIAGTLTYFFDPALATNKYYMCATVLILFWAATWLNCHGMRVSSVLSTVGALLGTIFPMVFIGLLGIWWMIQGRPLQTTLDWAHFLPEGSQLGNLAFLTNVLFGLLGLEMAATHAAEMKNPRKDYPRSLFISVIIIFFTITLGSLAIAIVVPNRELNLATGVMQAFQIFLHALDLPWLTPVIAACIILGSLSGVGAWIIGPTKGLLVAAQDGSLPPFFSKMNHKGVPVRILLTQASLVTLLSLFFLIFPTVNDSYWILSVITAQLALIVYVALFASAMKLHYQKPHVPRSFRIPGHRIGLWVVCLLGAMTCLTVIGFGFLPPDQVPFQSVSLYEMLLTVGIAACLFLPLYWIQRTNIH